MSSTTYPVRIQGHLDGKLSRWLWLVKWLLAIPHQVVLVLLWTAFAVSSVIAFFAILFTSRYPASIFEFNVGVLRWSWRVAYYAYGALGTDRYPPFTLEDDPGYPARLSVAYPERLSRGLVLVKWWLLAIPHYVIVGVLIGGAWFTGRGAWIGSGLIGVLVLIAAVVLAFTGRYPRQLFDFILGLNRWVIRVAAYAGLMTDEYPPFRLDMGQDEGTLTVPAPEAPPTGRSQRHWTPARITSFVLGSVLALASLSMLFVGSVAMWAHLSARDEAGFISTPEQRFTASGYALATDDISIDVGKRIAGSLLGDLRVRVMPSDPEARVFIGIGPADDIAAVLDDVEHTVITDVMNRSTDRLFEGGAPTTALPSYPLWAASSSGGGARSFVWPVGHGAYSIVVVNTDGARGLDFVADIAATFPSLQGIAAGLLATGVATLVLGLMMIATPIRRIGREAR